jgi:hypothetical protein
MYSHSSKTLSTTYNFLKNKKKSKSFAYAYLQYPYQHSVEQEGLHLKFVGGDSRTNDVPYIEYALSFLKNG